MEQLTIAKKENRPFLGLKSYEEQHQSIFGGREAEVSKLIKFIDANTLTVVFGKSGIGKTSLLKAGLLPKLRRHFYLPIYIRINFLSLEAPLDQVKKEIEQQVLVRDGEAIHFEGRSLWEYFHEVVLLEGMLQPVLILDQFEEIFTLGKSKAKQVNEFIRELGDLAENRVPWKVQEKNLKMGNTVSSAYADCNYKLVLSMREDYLPNLEGMKKYMPSIKNSRFRVLQMNGKQAVKAIVKSGKGIMDEATSITLVKKLPKSAGYGLENLETGEDWEKRKVEPFLISLVCYELNEVRINQGEDKITEVHVEGGDIENAIATHYDSKVVDKFGNNLCIAIEELLVTAEGFRKLCIKSDFMEKYGIPIETVNALVDTRIIRQETRTGVDYIELIHDVLAPLIKDRRDQRHIEERKNKEREELRQELLKREEKAKEYKKWIFRYRLIGVVLLLLSVFIYDLSDRAVKAQAEAEAAKLEVEANRDTVNTKLALMEAHEKYYAGMLDDARQRENELTDQLKQLEAQAYQKFKNDAYDENFKEAKQLKEKKEYKKAIEYFQVAAQYVEEGEEMKTRNLKATLKEIEQQIDVNGKWSVDVFYLEESKEVSLPIARGLLPILAGQGYNVRIRMLSTSKNASGGYKVANNQIRIDGNESHIGQALSNTLELNGYNGFRLVTSTQGTPNYCSIFVQGIPENKALTQKGNQLYEDGWVYLGEYDPSDNSWKTRYLDYTEVYNNVWELEGQKATIRDETGQLNVRKSMPDRVGQFGDVIKVLHVGEELEIKHVEKWGNTNYVWALASYKIE